MGWVIDRFGPRIVSLVGITLFSAGFICLGRMDSLWTFYLTYALLVAPGAHGTALAPYAAAAARWFVKRRALAIGTVSAGGALGGALITPFIFPLVQNYGWRNTVWILGLGTLVLGWLLSFIIKPGRPEDYGLRPDGDTPEGAPETGRLPSQSEAYVPEADISVGQTLRERSILVSGRPVVLL